MRGSNVYRSVPATAATATGTGIWKHLKSGAVSHASSTGSHLAMCLCLITKAGSSHSENMAACKGPQDIRQCRCRRFDQMAECKECSFVVVVVEARGVGCDVESGCDRAAATQ